MARAKTQPTPAPTDALAPPAPETPAPVGRSTTGDPDRAQWEIDGKLYDVRDINDFGVGAQRRINRDGREFYKLWASDAELTDDQDKRMKQLLDRIFLGDEHTGPLIDAPVSLLRRIKDGDRADVVLHFTLGPLQRVMMAAAVAQAMAAPEAEDSASATTS